MCVEANMPTDKIKNLQNTGKTQILQKLQVCCNGLIWWFICRQVLDFADWKLILCSAVKTLWTIGSKNALDYTVKSSHYKNKYGQEVKIV